VKSLVLLAASIGLCTGTACGAKSRFVGDMHPAMYEEHTFLFSGSASEWESALVDVPSVAGWVPVACFKTTISAQVFCFYVAGGGRTVVRNVILGEATT
jgi:hypothetical protein